MTKQKEREMQEIIQFNRMMGFLQGVLRGAIPYVDNEMKIVLNDTYDKIEEYFK